MIMKTCKDCKYFEPYDGKDGYCSKIFDYEDYYSDVESSENILIKSYIGDPLEIFVSENFGCIRFEPTQAHNYKQSKSAPQ